MKPILFFFSALCVLPLQAQEAWDLKQCIDYAIGHNVTVKQQETARQQSEVELNTARWSRLPNLNGNASYSFNFGRSLQPDNTYQSNNVQSNNLSLSTSVPLFTGMRIPHTIALQKLNLKAATADLDDVNMIDPFHMEAYNKLAINYNRDIEIFPVLNALFEGIYGHNPYKSPTDMGVNMVGFCICDDQACREASNDEIIRRYYNALGRMALGAGNENEVGKISLLFKQAGITTADRRCTVAAKERQKESGMHAAAIELSDGTLITAGESPLLGPCAALLLNATKHLAGIPHTTRLIPQEMIEPIQKTKIDYLGGQNPRLHTDEVLVALSVLSQHNQECRRALTQLPELRGCQAHTTVMLSEVDQKIFKKLGVGLSSDPVCKR